MDLYVSKRGQGATTRLIQLCHEKGYLLICANDSTKNFTMMEAKKMNLTIKEPITLYDVFRGALEGVEKTECVVDDLNIGLMDVFHYNRVNVKEVHWRQINDEPVVTNYSYKKGLRSAKEYKKIRDESLQPKLNEIEDLLDSCIMQISKVNLDRYLEIVFVDDFKLHHEFKLDESTLYVNKPLFDIIHKLEDYFIDKGFNFRDFREMHSSNKIGLVW